MNRANSYAVMFFTLDECSFDCDNCKMWFVAAQILGDERG